MNNKRKWAFAAVASCVMTAVHADVSFSGFLSVGGGIADEEIFPVTGGDAYSYAGYNSEDFTFDSDTLFGLQVSSEISEKLRVTGQFVARGTEDYSVSAEWAYISYEVNDQFTWRMGRFRTPLYLYSDYVDVGYAYSWIRTPRAVYYLPFNNVQGADFIWRFQLGSWDGSVQGYYGALTDSFFNTDFQATLSTELRNQMGVAFSVGNDWLTLRAAYHQADLALTGYETPQLQGLIATLNGLGFSDNANRLITDDSGNFLAFGYTIDTGMFVSSGEVIEFEVEDSPFSLDKRAYVMAGLRFGDVLVHITHAKTEDEAADLSSGIPNAGPLAAIVSALNGIAAGSVAEVETNSIGLRWDFTPGSAFKLQYDMTEDTSPGNLADFGQSDVELNVVSFAIQTVF
ncbi:DNA topoisomerase IV [Permianibacter aggregans]|uniref:Porin-like protein n=1 Tax=Permianibacter aggregans TaxID=1510150 RepID=A0A4R6UHD8_9GAMM|nr:DNA topoisomerase IV [Permianibacter aggregans]QGX41173.1 DNA topoisomerase IV [Permianibacter aggregans]TDQ45772.1 hypothetical protein EV696_1175 [Permianibacter aggregans]